MPPEPSPYCTHVSNIRARRNTRIVINLDTLFSHVLAAAVVDGSHYIIVHTHDGLESRYEELRMIEGMVREKPKVVDCLYHTELDVVREWVMMQSARLNYKAGTAEG